MLRLRFVSFCFHLKLDLKDKLEHADLVTGCKLLSSLNRIELRCSKSRSFVEIVRYVIEKQVALVLHVFTTQASLGETICNMNLTDINLFDVPW